MVIKLSSIFLLFAKIFFPGATDQQTIINQIKKSDFNGFMDRFERAEDTLRNDVVLKILKDESVAVTKQRKNEFATCEPTHWAGFLGTSTLGLSTCGILSIMNYQFYSKTNNTPSLKILSTSLCVGGTIIILKKTWQAVKNYWYYQEYKKSKLNDAQTIASELENFKFCTAWKNKENMKIFLLGETMRDVYADDENRQKTLRNS